MVQKSRGKPISGFPAGVNMGRRSGRILGAVGLMALAVAGCGADPTDMSADGGDSNEDKVSNKIVGSVQEWSVQVSAHKAEAGEVTFTVTNQGTIQHEFLVVKTEYKPGEIPIADGEKRFAEDDPGLTVVDEIPEWPPGETKTLKVKLDPGSYQVVCNIEDHYKAGMWAPLTVAA